MPLEEDDMSHQLGPDLLIAQPCNNHTNPKGNDPTENPAGNRAGQLKPLTYRRLAGLAGAAAQPSAPSAKPPGNPADMEDLTSKFGKLQLNTAQQLRDKDREI